jgi:hypothetical protein
VLVESANELALPCKPVILAILQVLVQRLAHFPSKAVDLIISHLRRLTAATDVQAPVAPGENVRYGIRDPLWYWGTRNIIQSLSLGGVWACAGFAGLVVDGGNLGRMVGVVALVLAGCYLASAIARYWRGRRALPRTALAGTEGHDHA